MAKYITSPILFEAYVHIDGNYDEIEDAEEALRRAVNDYIQHRAKHFLYDDVDSEVRFKEGSIKAYATIRGSLRSCLAASYSDFSKEIDSLFWFAKRLSDAAVMEVTFMTGSYLRAIARTEARPGVIGRTKYVVDSFLSIRQTDNEKQAGGTIKRVRRLKRQIQSLLTYVGEDDVALLTDEFRKLLAKAPKKLGMMRSLAGETEGTYKSAIDDLTKLLN
jgi:hypothetical protein